MPSKKKKYNARFPAGRIKKIMQTDEEVGKVAQAVPVIISRTLELFVESLLTKSMQITQSRNAKTLTPSHMKQCILSESRFDFLKDLVKNIPDASIQEDNENNASEVLDYSTSRVEEEEEEEEDESINKESKSEDDVIANFYTEQSTSAARTPVIQYGPKIAQIEPPRLHFSAESLARPEKRLHVDLTNIPALVPTTPTLAVTQASFSKVTVNELVSNSEKVPDVVDNVPQLIPITHNFYAQNTGDNLYIDEDYDN